MSRIFISYRRVEPDQAVARLLYHHLTELDHNVFFDAEDIPLGAFWDKEIAENVRRSDSFIPLISSSYLFSPYIIEKELKVAAKLLAEKKIERILQVNLAFDGDPPEAVREVVTQIQHFKWRSPADTPRLCQEIAAQLPTAELLVKGMRPFVTADQKLFSQLGREDDISTFLSQLANPAPIMLVHGVSGAGKTSFLKAGVAPRLGDTRWTIVELTGNASFDALAAEDCQLLVLDQFEQSLIRFASNDDERQTFQKSVGNWLAQVAERKVIFCLRDEYRTAFDTMLPQLSSRCVNFPVVPLRPEAASRVLALLLDSVGVEYDAEFLPRLCAEYLAENVPKTVLPAILQLLAQYCQNRRIKLDKVTWDRLVSSNFSLFEDHLRETVLERLPRNVPQLEAIESLAALTEADVKSRRKSVREIADETRLNEQSVSRTLELAAMSHARIVTVEPDVEENRPTYRLVHDLFAPAVLSLHREVKRRRDARRRVAVVTALALLLFVSAVAGALAFRQWRVAAQQRNEAVVRRLTAEAKALLSGPRSYLMQSLVLGAEAHRRKPTWESDSALRAALDLLPLPVAQMAHGSTVAAAKFSRDGQRVVTAGLAGGKSEVRVWEVYSNSKPAVLVLDREVNAVAFSDDGNLIAIGAGKPVGSAGVDGSVIVWDLKHNTKVETGMSTPVTEVGFLSGTKRVVAVGSNLARVLTVDASEPEVTIDFDATSSLTCLSANATKLAVANGLAVKVYGLPEGRVLLEKTIEVRPDDKIVAMAFNREGTVFALAATMTSIPVWDVVSGRLIKEISSTVRSTSTLAVSDDGSLLAHAEYSGFITVRDLKGAERDIAGLQPDVRAIPSEGKQMRLAFRPNSYHLIAVTDGLTVRYLAVRYIGGQLHDQGMKEVFRAVPEARINSVALSADGTHAVVGDANGRATIWRWRAGWRDDPGLWRMTFSPSGRFLIGKSNEGTELFDMSTVSRIGIFPQTDLIQQSFALSPDGSMVAIRSGENREFIDVYNSHAQTRRQQLNVGDDLKAFAFSPDSRRLTCLFRDDSLSQTELDGGAQVKVIMGPAEEINRFFSPSGKYVVTEERKGPGKHVVSLFDLESQRKVLEFETSESRVYLDFTFSADERFAAAKIDRQTVGAWEIGTGRELMRFPVHDTIPELALAGEGLMAVGLRQEVIVLDLKTKNEVWRFNVDIGTIREINLSPDGQHLIVGSTEDKIRIWNIGRRELVTVIDDIEVEFAKFSPDGKYLLIRGQKPPELGQYEFLLLWRPQDLLDEACGRVTRNITETDWREFFGADAYENAPCGSRPSQLLRSY